jgi:hypothetical protein
MIKLLILWLYIIYLRIRYHFRLVQFYNISRLIVLLVFMVKFRYTKKMLMKWNRLLILFLIQTWIKYIFLKHFRRHQSLSIKQLWQRQMIKWYVINQYKLQHFMYKIYKILIQASKSMSFRKCIFKKRFILEKLY